MGHRSCVYSFTHNLCFAITSSSLELSELWGAAYFWLHCPTWHCCNT